MTFAEIERSRDKGEPVELYLFRYGVGATHYFAYTDAERSITIYDDALAAEVTYQPTPIDRDEIRASGTLDNSTLEVRTPQASGLADLFRQYPPSETVTLTIRQGHANDADEQFLVAWAGRVLGFKIRGAAANYTCEPISTSLRRAGLRRNYQYGCPHALYGPQCKANKSAASTAVVVVSISGSALTFASNWTTNARKPKYENGIAEWVVADGRIERRGILRSNLDGVVTLDGRPTGLAPGATVTLILGCNHTTVDCGGVIFTSGMASYDAAQNLHNNIRNYGGQPWIPLKNPVGIRNNFY